MKKKKVTVTTLSKELGVSAATISRALNNSPELNAETIAKIRQKAEEYGFRPRQKASRAINICALIPNADLKENCFSPFTMEVVSGMMEYLLEQDLEFSMYSDTFEKLNNGLLLRHLGRRNISGVVLINPPNEGIFYDSFKKNHFPYVNLFIGPTQPAQNFLSLDNVEIGFRATNYLIDIGHREIAIVVSPPNGITGSDRFKGHKKALKEANIPENPALAWQATKGQYGLKLGYDAVMDLHSSGTNFTALFVMSDNVAIGALHALHTLGLSVPKQVSLLTCDDAPMLSYTYPPLSVIDIPNRKFGYTAAKRVHRMITGEAARTPPREPWMRGELIIRESTAPPPHKKR